MIEVRDMIKNHVRYVIGNGKHISIWYDKWCEQGPLCEYITRRTIFDARLEDSMKVADMFNEGKWNWPSEWMINFLNIGKIDIPSWQDDKKDKVQWFTNKNLLMDFSTKQAWEDLRIDNPSVGWCKVVWFNQMVPRHAFILWLAMQGRLMTQDRMEKWQTNGTLFCTFCQAGPDSHEHLFFQCPYTMEIWDCMRKMTNLQNVSYRMDNSVQEIAENKVQNNIGMVVCKLVLAASVTIFGKKGIIDCSRRKKEMGMNYARALSIMLG
uniref:uncharacterized protein LOC122604480 n=1 Tax=Erigeron canadensis TaxID=72917 RepID=UPI001CB90CD9|nr:uncharacterized protein LOC122604480 [Erigeron canadensis]